jgi:hypothetical protein
MLINFIEQFLNVDFCYRIKSVQRLHRAHIRPMDAAISLPVLCQETMNSEKEIN